MIETTLSSARIPAPSPKKGASLDMAARPTFRLLGPVKSIGFRGYRRIAAPIFPAIPARDGPA
jgi:hypothetical protein